jgi:excisionase family DNA binding protein
MTSNDESHWDIQLGRDDERKHLNWARLGARPRLKLRPTRGEERGTSDIEATLEAMIESIVERVLDKKLAAVKPTAEYLSTAEAAKLAGVVPDTIHNWIARRHLRKYRAGRVVRVNRAELEQFLKHGGQRPCNDLTPEEAAERDFGEG